MFKIRTLRGGENLNIGKILRLTRKQTDLTQEDMAYMINISRSSISKIERNEMSLQTEDFIRWMQVIQSRLPNTTTIEAGVSIVNGVDLSVLVDMLTQFVGLFAWLGG